MTNLPAAAGVPDSDQLSQQELDRLSYAITERFAPHLHAAATAVRDAEHALAEAREAVARAQQAAEDASYRSDPLVFMRVTVSEELAGLARKTTPKKVRANFRYLLDRAIELAEGEVSGYQRDIDAARLDQTQGIEACRRAEQATRDELEAARFMQQRVHEVERASREGLEILREKLGPDPS